MPKTDSALAALLWTAWWFIIIEFLFQGSEVQAWLMRQLGA